MASKTIRVLPDHYVTLAIIVMVVTVLVMLNNGNDRLVLLTIYWPGPVARRDWSLGPKAWSLAVQMMLD